MSVTCDICNVIMQDSTSYQNHIQGKKHLKNNQIELRRLKNEKSIFVSRFPRNKLSEDPNQVLKFFSKYGVIVDHRFGPYHAIIEFESKESCQVLLKNHIYFENSRLNIQPKIAQDNNFITKKDSAIGTINNSTDIIYDNIKSNIEKGLTFDDQLATFLDKILLTDNAIETLYDVTYIKLNTYFKSAFPTSTTYKFGSTVSGLGFKNCDLDIYLDIGFPISQDNGGHNSKTYSSAGVFNDIKRILYSKPRIFSKIVPIPKAKTPVIKFTYLPTNISCDITFKNSLGVCNSQLIKYCLLLDPRLRPAMLIIKYWLCNMKFKLRDVMSKYSLTLMFIFYLQQPSVKLIPPIIDLMKHCKPVIVEGWQVNFNWIPGNRLFHENAVKHQSIPELLHGFFDFYANYNFKLNVACTIDGLSHSKTIFENVKDLPSSMDRYKEYIMNNESAVALAVNKPMCVQDPIEMNHNVTGNICANFLEIFQSYCEAAAEICKESAKNDYKNLLTNLFTLSIKIKTKKSKFTFLITADSTLKVSLPDDLDSRTDIENKPLYIKNNWFTIVMDIIKRYFEHVLQLQVQFIVPEKEKQQKMNTDSDVHTQDQNKISMHCTGDYCMWRDRGNYNNSLDPSMTILDKEIQLTENKFLVRKDKLQKVQIDFDCEIYKKYNKNPHILLVFDNNNYDTKIFREFANYVKHKLPFVITKTIIHMQQFKTKLPNES